jgi:hypothetical protein
MQCIPHIRTVQTVDFKGSPMSTAFKFNIYCCDCLENALSTTSSYTSNKYKNIKELHGYPMAHHKSLDACVNEDERNSIERGTHKLCTDANVSAFDKPSATNASSITPLLQNHASTASTNQLLQPANNQENIPPHNSSSVIASSPLVKRKVTDKQPLTLASNPIIRYFSKVKSPFTDTVTSTHGQPLKKRKTMSNSSTNQLPHQFVADFVINSSTLCTNNRSHNNNGAQ